MNRNQTVDAGDVCRMRSMIEMAYYFAWGPQGNDTARSLFKVQLNDLKPIVGDFTWDGNRFSWVAIAPWANAPNNDDGDY